MKDNSNVEVEIQMYYNEDNKLRYNFKVFNSLEKNIILQEEDFETAEEVQERIRNLYISFHNLYSDYVREHSF